MYNSDKTRRLSAVFLLFLFFFLAAGLRLFYLQFFRGAKLVSIAQQQHNLFIEIEPRRGTIFDALGRPQAANIAVDSLYACPNAIADSAKEEISYRLASILQLSQTYLMERLSRKKSFVWLARKISPDKSEAIKKLNIKGIDFMRETKRCYPNSYLASHIIGFAGLDNVGLEGIERQFDRYLKGEPGWMVALRDARQRKLNLFERVVLPKDGYDLVLTIDEVIQYIVEKELERACRVHQARGGSVVVMNPHTGAILALANFPTYDLNAYAESHEEQRRNRAICDLFEPGSVFKIVTASAALEQKKVNEEEKFFCENGSYRIANHTLHDHTPHGWLTFKQVIEQSSNIGTAKIAQRLGADVVYNYSRLFGFGSKTGIDLPGEISGMLKEPKYWSKTSIGAIPIGQEIGVTVLQLARAISVIANGGKLVRPFVVKEIRDKFGQTIKEFSGEHIREVISSDTARRMAKILQGVVESGTGKLARIPGYSAAGKTGTAQKVEPSGVYSHTRFVASFIGFAPVDNPVLAVAVSIDEPKPYHFGGVVAAPVFKNVCQEALRYLKVKPENELEMASINEISRVN